MSWVVEHLHRDGSVLERIPVATADSSATEAIEILTIGRALDNHLVLDDPHCAAHHARLEITVNGRARLVDLDTQNGIVFGRNQRAKSCDITDDRIYRLGNSQIRIRSSAWPLTPERPLSRRAAWPFALLGLAIALCYGAWQIWLRDVQDKSPPYLYELCAEAAAICLWSGTYALFGRLVSGVDRFFSHLLIASIGYLCGQLVLGFLDTLAFSTSWLWPIRITEPVIVLVVAMTVRFHLRLADPRHWRSLRVGLAIVVTLAIVVPVAQLWISQKRLTNVQTHAVIRHPFLRLAAPVSMQEFSAIAPTLKEKADAAKKKDDDGNDGQYESYDVD